MRRRIQCAVLAAAAVVLLSANASAQEALRTRLVLLGTGTPNADPERSGPATAVVVDDQVYLFDAGPGIVRRAAQAARDREIPALRASNLKRVLPDPPPLRSHHRPPRPPPGALGTRPKRSAARIRSAGYAVDDGGDPYGVVARHRRQAQRLRAARSEPGSPSSRSPRDWARHRVRGRPGAHRCAGG